MSTRVRRRLTKMQKHRKLRVWHWFRQTFPDRARRIKGDTAWYMGRLERYCEIALSEPGRIGTIRLPS